MSCFHRFLSGVALLIVSAASLSAQTAPTTPAPDSTRVATLPTVTVTAEGNWFTRADDRRQMVLDAMAENRRLASQLREYDARAVQLALRLDSLKRIEFVQKIAIQTLDDSVKATRARRLALEARVLALEPRQPQP